MIPGEKFYKMSNASFAYGLSPVQHTAYSYLVCCAGQKGYCWPSVKTIAACCGCSEETARRTLHTLAEKGFIRIEPRYEDKHGVRRQTSNNYFLLDPPTLNSRGGTAPGSTDKQYEHEQGKHSDADLLPI